jgi:hypothetical protein
VPAASASSPPHHSRQLARIEPVGLRARLADRVTFADSTITGATCGSKIRATSQAHALPVAEDPGVDGQHG